MSLKSLHFEMFHFGGVTHEILLKLRALDSALAVKQNTIYPGFPVLNMPNSCASFSPEDLSCVRGVVVGWKREVSMFQRK